MELKQIIDRIQSLYSKGTPSDDTRLSDRLIYNKLITLRSKYISLMAKKKQKISQWNYQTIDCVELIKVTTHNCPCLPPIGCEILRTKYELPSVMTDLNKHLIQSVTSIEGSLIFSEIPFKDAKYKRHNKYTSTKPDFFIKDDYLYLIGLDKDMRKLKYITIIALFEEPLEALKYPTACGEDKSLCLSPLDEDFPIDLQMLDAIVAEVNAELLDIYSMTQHDVSNNTDDSVISSIGSAKLKSQSSKNKEE